MDIKKELMELSSSDNFGDKILENMEYEKQEFNKKLYLVQMLSTAKKLDRIIEVGVFQNNDIDSFRVNVFGTTLKKKFHKIMFNCTGEDFITDSHEREFFNIKLKEVFNNIEEIDLSLVSEKMINKPEFYLDLEQGIGQKILDLFLSDELKKVLEYNNMQLELPSNNEINNKKPKI
jgi:hypothetical protein